MDRDGVAMRMPEGSSLIDERFVAPAELVAHAELVVARFALERAEPRIIGRRARLAFEAAPRAARAQGSVAL